MNLRAASLAELSLLEGRTGCVLTRHARGIAAIDSKAKCRGVVAYDGWTVSGVQAHMWTDAPVVWRHLLPAVFRYPFEECGKSLLVGVIPADNPASTRMAERLGFRLAYRQHDGWAKGIPLHVYEMRREECRFLKG